MTLKQTLLETYEAHVTFAHAHSCFLSFLTEIDYELPLPPPKPAAKQLKEKTVEFIQQWQDKFGEAYKKLSLGYHFLKNCKKASLQSCFYSTPYLLHHIVSFDQLVLKLYACLIKFSSNVKSAA